MRNWLAKYQETEQQRTGIKTIKVRHNKVFGYYIEVSKGQLKNVPEDYVRKQTLVNAERFITPELKEYESKVLGSEERLKGLEHEVFTQVLGSVREEADQLQRTAAALAAVDLLASLSVVAKRHGYRWGFCYQGGYHQPGQFDRYAIRRTAIEPDIDVPMFRALTTLPQFIA